MRKFNVYAATTISSWLLFILVLAAELYAPFKLLLVSLLFHHWIAKGVIVALAFVGSGFFLKRKIVVNIITKHTEEQTAFHSVIAVLLLILLFYVIEFFV